MILDDYSLEKSLGKGAFGEVFLTTKKGTNKLFATKKMEKEFFENETTKKYLLNEIYILKELNHPNIVQFADLKRTKNHFYIIMEYCNGGELFKALERHKEKTGKPFSQEVVQNLMKQIISAFQYIHGKNILHRDIKLENILLNYDNEEDRKNENIMKATVKIIDFGFAAKIDKLGLKYTTLGSPINMDPLILSELQKRGKKTKKLGYDQKADIWSLGTICYEMSIGKNVFDADEIDDLIQKVEKGEYTVPTSLSKELISFINGMLQYDPKKRLNIEQLSKHSFLNKNVKDFEKIDLKRVNNNVVKSKLKMNVKANQTIWAIFNDEDEDKLMKIKGDDFGKDKPIAEDYVKGNSNNNINVKINNIDNNASDSNVKVNQINNNIKQNNINKNNINNNNNNLNKNLNNNNTNNNLNNNINKINLNNNITNNNLNNNINKNNLNNNNINKNNINNYNINNNFNKNFNNNINKNNLINNNINNNKNIYKNNNYLNQKPNIPINNNNNIKKYNDHINQNMHKHNYNYNLNYNKNNIPQYYQQRIPNIQNPIVNRGSFPIYGYAPQAYQGTTYGFQGVQANIFQGVGGRPMATYQQVPQTQGYMLNTGYYPYRVG